MSPLDRLKALASEVNAELPMLNAGGCCVYASHVADGLAAHGIEARGVMVDPYGIDYYRRGGFKHGAWHIILEFEYAGKTYWHDSDHLRDVTGNLPRALNLGILFNIPVQSYRLTRDEMREWANRACAWNHTFDRDKGIPIITREVKEHLLAA